MSTLDDLARVERELRAKRPVSPLNIGDDAAYRIAQHQADTIAAYIAAQRERDAGGWQPIETAPKDTMILVFARYGVEPAIAHWSTYGWRVGVEHHETACGSYCLGGYPSGFVSEATHWMPLPAAPSGSQSQAKLAPKENGDG